MKKKIMYAVACVALAAVTGWNYQQSKQNVELSDLTLENVEALASGEGSGSCNWATREVAAGWEAICISGGPGYSCHCRDVKRYY